MKWFLPLSLLLLLAALPAGAGNLPGFNTEQAAEQHCPGSGIVWFSIETKTYYLKGNKNYGRTKGGAYVCQPDADALGFRPARQ